MLDYVRKTLRRCICATSVEAVTVNRVWQRTIPHTASRWVLYRFKKAQLVLISGYNCNPSAYSSVIVTVIFVTIRFDKLWLVMLSSQVSNTSLTRCPNDYNSRATQFDPVSKIDFTADFTATPVRFVGELGTPLAWQTGITHYFIWTTLYIAIALFSW